MNEDYQRNDHAQNEQYSFIGGPGLVWGLTFPACGDILSQKSQAHHQPECQYRNHYCRCVHISNYPCILETRRNNFESILTLPANSTPTHIKFLKDTIKLKDFQGPYVLAFHLKNIKKDSFRS